MCSGCSGSKGGRGVSIHPPLFHNLCPDRVGQFFMSAFSLAGYYTLAMTLDCDLLRRYAETRSEDAFAELVRRHVNLVYSAAMGQVNGDSDARNAAALSGRQLLTGWLYTCTHFTAAKAVRKELRRRTHEQEAHAMHELCQCPAPDIDWEHIRQCSTK